MYEVDRLGDSYHAGFEIFNLGFGVPTPGGGGIIVDEHGIRVVDPEGNTVFEVKPDGTSFHRGHENFAGGITVGVPPPAPSTPHKPAGTFTGPGPVDSFFDVFVQLTQPTVGVEGSVVVLGSEGEPGSSQPPRPALTLVAPGVPHDFFDPGSDPFWGWPTALSAIGPSKFLQPPPTDTVVARPPALTVMGSGADPAVLDPIPIEVVSLSLVSVAPVMMLPATTPPSPLFLNQFMSMQPTLGVSGNVLVDGQIAASVKAFRIDHPLHPETHQLVHASIESSEMMNVYSGNVVLDESGEAWVHFLDWFEALNMDFRYQLTCVGGYAPVYVAEEIQGNRFKIAGGKPGLKVSWQVSGVRHDTYARNHPLQVEVSKTALQPDGNVPPKLTQLVK